jgi:cytoskeleton protein RodZ
MQTIGSLLKSLRLKQNYSIKDISAKTQIAPYLLKYLENDEFENLPSSTFTKGFIVNVAKVLDLKPSKALAIFRRDFIINESGKILPRDYSKPLQKTTFITSKIISTSFVIIFFIAFFIYLFYQIKDYNSAPEIDLTRPPVNAIVKGPNIPVKGYVSADSTVYINGAIIEVFPTGLFQASTQLPAGDHIIEIKAINSRQKSTTINIPVTVVDK